MIFLLQIQTRSNTHEKTSEICCCESKLVKERRRFQIQLVDLFLFYSVNLPLPANKKSETFIVETPLLFLQLPRWKYKNINTIFFVFLILINNKIKVSCNIMCHAEKKQNAYFCA